VITKLDFLVRFWELSARHATLGHPLVPSEQVELLSLMQLVHAHARVDEDDEDEDDDAIPAQLIGHGAILSVEVRELSALGVRVSCADLLGEGTSVVIRAADALSGVEYVLPCRVAWVEPGAPNVMLLKVDGVPSRKNFFSSVDTRARSSFAMGRPQRLVG